MPLHLQEAPIGQKHTIIDHQLLSKQSLILKKKFRQAESILVIQESKNKSHLFGNFINNVSFLIDSR